MHLEHHSRLPKVNSWPCRSSCGSSWALGSVRRVEKQQLCTESHHLCPWVQPPVKGRRGKRWSFYSLHWVSTHLSVREPQTKDTQPAVYNLLQTAIASVHEREPLPSIPDLWRPPQGRASATHHQWSQTWAGRRTDTSGRPSRVWTMPKEKGGVRSKVGIFQSRHN